MVKSGALALADVILTGDAAFLRTFSVTDPDPLPRNALEREIPTSTVFGESFWQTV